MAEDEYYDDLFDDEEENQNSEGEEEGREGDGDNTMFSPDAKKKSAFTAVNHKDRVFIIKGDSSSAIDVITLPLPTRDIAAKFFIQNKQLLELQRVSDEPCSWFIGDSVEKDGGLYMATPVDPLLIALPLVEKSRNKKEGHDGYFLEIDQIMVSGSYPDVSKLYKTDGFDLCVICDKQEIVDKEMYRLNDELVAKWLKQKADRLVVMLSEDSSLVSTTVASVSTFVRSGTSTGPSKDEILKTAFGFLSEYVTIPWLSIVGKSFGIADVGAMLTPVPSLATALIMPIQPTQRDSSSSSYDTPKKTPTKKPTTPQPTTQQKRLANAAKGSASISSFFSAVKKPKV